MSREHRSSSGDGASPSGTPFEVNTTYEPFSEEPEYIEANREFVTTLGLDATTHPRVLDLACGTGLMAELALEVDPRLELLGLDISHESLLLAVKRFSTIDESPPMLIRATADRIPVKGRSVDAVLMGNSIHLVPDRGRLLDEVAQVLRPGGLFAFNGSFYAGTMVSGTEVFYREWVKQALLHVQAVDRERRSRGQPGIVRKRGTVSRAFSVPWLSREEWAGVLGQRGFEVHRSTERSVTMTEHSLQTIGAYSGMASVLLSGYPVVEASLALQSAVGPALRACDRETVPRRWLEVAATMRNGG